MKQPHLTVGQDDCRDAQRVDRLRVDAGERLALLDDLLEDGAVRTVGGVRSLEIGVVADGLGMYALAEGGVNGLDDIIRVRLREIAQCLERGGRGLRAFLMRSTSRP